MGVVNPNQATILASMRNGAWGIGYVPPEANGGLVGHAYLITGYDPVDNWYYLYDGTTGRTGRRRPHELEEFLFGIIK